MWQRLSILLLVLPFMLFVRLAVLYMSPEGLLFAFFVGMALMCCGLASVLWWLGGLSSDKEQE